MIQVHAARSSPACRFRPFTIPLCFLFMISCNNPSSATEDDSAVVAIAITGEDADSVLEDNSADHEEDSDYQWSSADEVAVTLSDSSITVGGADGVTASDSGVTITAPGTYRLAGTLSDGQIVVDSDGVVRLILDGVSLSSSTTAPLYIKAAEKAILVVADGTTNTVTDAGSRVSDDEAINAAIFSKDDLSIYGSGSGTLAVNGNYEDGVTSKDGLVIRDATIAVEAADDGIRGKDYLVIRGACLTVTSSGDGLKSDNDEDDSLGYVSVESGTLSIDSGSDGIQAETDLVIQDGSFSIVTSQGADGSLSSDDSAKGLKGGVCVVLDGGTYDLDCADDCIHSNGTISVNGGSYTLASGDDGIHADTSLAIVAGTIDITRSYEGIESAIISINGGTTSIVSEDDGVNVAGGNDGSSSSSFSSTSSRYLYIHGGYLAVYASGDGLDSNGSIVMTEGTVIVHGPTANDNAALDYDGSFTISGGTLVAVGSSGMAQAPSSGSSQYSLAVTYTGTKTAGTLIHLEDSSGTDLLTFAPAKAYGSLVVSSPSLSSGSSYKLYSGGSSTGTEADGLYSGASYSAGTLMKTFSLSSVVTSLRL